MYWLLMAKISQRCVANLGNSPAITGDLRLALKNFFSPSTQPRMNQRLLNFVFVTHPKLGLAPFFSRFSLSITRQTFLHTNFVQVIDDKFSLNNIGFTDGMLVTLTAFLNSYSSASGQLVTLV